MKIFSALAIVLCCTSSLFGSSYYNNYYSNVGDYGMGRNPSQYAHHHYATYPLDYGYGVYGSLYGSYPGEYGVNGYYPFNYNYGGYSQNPVRGYSQNPARGNHLESLESVMLLCRINPPLCNGNSTNNIVPYALGLGNGNNNLMMLATLFGK